MTAKKKEAGQMAVAGFPEPAALPHTTWTGHVSFGLISIPVKLHTGARGGRIEFNQIHSPCPNAEAGSRVKQLTKCQSCENEVSRDQLLKGYEYEKGKYVMVTADELKAVEPESNKVMEITDFVAIGQVDPLLLESSYLLSPAPGGERAFGLLRSALLQTGRAAVSKVVMHGREHLVIIRPFGNGLSLHTLFYRDEVPAYQIPIYSAGNPAEQKVAVQLVEALASDFKHDIYADSYATNVKELLKARIEGRAPAPVLQMKKREEPVDIMSGMLASIQAAKARKKAA